MRIRMAGEIRRRVFVENKRAGPPPCGGADHDFSARRAPAQGFGGAAPLGDQRSDFS